MLFIYLLAYMYYFNIKILFKINYAFIKKVG